MIIEERYRHGSYIDIDITTDCESTKVSNNISVIFILEHAPIINSSLGAKASTELSPEQTGTDRAEETEESKTKRRSLRARER